MAESEWIFISYRRADTEGYAGRLEDSLSAYFGRGRVFRDIEDIQPGEDFAHRIERGVACAKAVIVLIGPDWLVSKDGGRSRLFDPDDFVAAEVAAALEGPGLTIPVLVQGARMPLEDDLPDRLKPLSRRNAMSLSNESWWPEVTRLARVLAMDVSESVTERRLGRVQRIVLSLFGATLLYGVLWLVWGPSTQNYHFALAIIPLMLGGLALAATAKWFHPSRRRWVWAAVITAFTGGIVTYLLYTRLGPASTASSAARALAHTCATLALSLTFVSLSGFKASDWME